MSYDELQRKPAPARTTEPEFIPRTPVTLNYAHAALQRQAAEEHIAQFALQRQRDALAQFLTPGHAIQRQAAAPVLEANHLRQQDILQRQAERTFIQRHANALRAELDGKIIVQRQTEAPTIPPVFAAPPLQRAAMPAPTVSDYAGLFRYEVSVQRTQLDSIGWVPHDRVAAIQRRATEGLLTAYRASSMPALQRQQDLARNLAELGDFGATVQRAVLQRLPAAERPIIQRFMQEHAQELEQQEALQRKAEILQRLEAQLQEEAHTSVVQRIQARRGSGVPLPVSVQRHLEQGLNADLSHVRVHTDGEADFLSKSVGAVAFTTGQDIYFRSGTYDPHSRTGLKLIAHEATHAVQQAQGRVQGGGIDPDHGLEVEAQRMGERLASTPKANVRTGNPVSYKPSTHAPATTGFSVQRFEDEEHKKKLKKLQQAAKDNAIVNGAKQTGKFIKDFGTGVYKGGKDMVTGLWDLGKGAVKGGWNLTAGWLTNPKGAKDTWKKTSAGLKAAGAFGKDAVLAASPLAWLLNSKASLAATKRMGDRGKALFDAVKQPYVEAWSKGNYGEAFGRGTVEVVTALLGTKGLDKLGKAGKIAKVGRTGKAATTARNVTVRSAQATRAQAARQASGKSHAARQAYKAARRAPRVADFEKFKAEQLSKLAGQQLSQKELRSIIARERRRNQIRGKDLHRLRYHMDAPTGRMAQIDDKAGKNYQRILDHIIKSKDHLYRYTTRETVNNWYRDPKTPGIHRGSYMTDTYFPSNRLSMDKAQVAKEWGVHDVGIRIPREALDGAKVARPYGDRAKLGWELFTHAYPEYGKGHALQFLAKTKGFDDAWLFDLLDNYAAAPTKALVGK